MVEKSKPRHNYLSTLKMTLVWSIIQLTDFISSCWNTKRSWKPGRWQIFKKVISLDLDMRTFLTGYTTYGFSFESDMTGWDRICRHLHRADRLYSKMNQITPYQTFEHNYKKRQNMKKAMLRTFTKVRNKINECHHKMSKFHRFESEPRENRMIISFMQDYISMMIVCSPSPFVLEI